MPELASFSPPIQSSLPSHFERKTRKDKISHLEFLLLLLLLLSLQLIENQEPRKFSIPSFIYYDLLAFIKVWAIEMCACGWDSSDIRLPSFEGFRTECPTFSLSLPLSLSLSLTQTHTHTNTNADSHSGTRTHMLKPTRLHFVIFLSFSLFQTYF